MKSSFEWNFTAQDGRKNRYGALVSSPEFSGGAETNSLWQMEFYWRQYSSFHRGIRLHLISSNVRKMRVRYTITFGFVRELIDLTSVKGVRIVENPNIDIVANHDDFFPESLYELISNRFSHMYIKCELEILVVPGQLIIKDNGLEVPSSENLLNDSQFSDMTIKTSSESFLVNTRILSARSPVFRAMFEDDMRERNENVVSVPDVDPVVMRELLHYIYCGRVKSFAQAIQLFWAADKYQVNELKIKCLEVLCGTISCQNALEIYVLANSTADNEKLITFVTSYIVDNIKDIVAKPNHSVHDNALLWNILRETVKRYVPYQSLGEKKRIRM